MYGSFRKIAHFLNINPPTEQVLNISLINSDIAFNVVTKDGNLECASIGRLSKILLDFDAFFD